MSRRGGGCSGSFAACRGDSDEQPLTSILCGFNGPCFSPSPPGVSSSPCLALQDKLRTGSGQCRPRNGLAQPGAHSCKLLQLTGLEPQHTVERLRQVSQRAWTAWPASEGGLRALQVIVSESRVGTTADGAICGPGTHRREHLPGWRRSWNGS